MKNWIILSIVCILFASCETNISQEIQVSKLLETTKSWDGGLLPEIKGQPKVTIHRIVIPAKKELPKHLHPVITTGILLKGELTITTEEGQQIVLKEGEVLVEVSNTVHFGQNTGTTDAEILVFYVGNENSPLTVRTLNNE